jgi:regulator of sirC expression with transglutaminase-like and TPR domain
MDRRGHVYGVVTMKSAVTANLGFAVDVATLSSLLEKPNPVPIDRWLTIGVIDPRDWKTLFGAHWQQRGGKILVSGAGQGFAGRSLCLSTGELPTIPYEVAVKVRLDDEAGAAGLVFHSDGQYRHYGFYPTAGKLRLTLFEGPDVLSWKVLFDQPSEHYRPGQWNTLKVRIEKDRLICYVNDEIVVESTNQGPTTGQVGLAKFRDTQAEFRNFKVAGEIPASRIAPQEASRLEKIVEELPPLEQLLPAQLDSLAASAAGSGEIIQERIKDIEQQVSQLRRLANDIHCRHVCLQMAQMLKGEEDKPEEGQPTRQFDLLRAALLIAILDGEDIDIDAYLAQVDRMAGDIRKTFTKKTTDGKMLKAMDNYLFQDNGFHGSRFDYYHRANSYMNRVISDREGIPISLSVLYMELGRRLELSIEGVGLPRRFVVRFVPQEGEPQLIDVFDAATRLSTEDARRLAGAAGQPFPEELLAAVGHRAILTRMLNNLMGLAQQQDDKERMIRYLEMMMVVDPDSIQARGMRSILRYETGRTSAAIADLDWFLENKPAQLDLERIRQMRDLFLRDRGPR